MHTVVVIDTSIMTNVLDVPGKNQSKSDVVKELTKKIKRGDTLVISVGAILEAGNHIAQLGDGNQRRTCANALCQMVEKGLDNSVPWTVSQEITHEELKEILYGFANEATAGVGLVDISIRREWERQCELNPGRRVTIWSLDTDLQGYDKSPSIGY